MPEITEDDDKHLRLVLDRAAKDATFRQELIKNPHAAVKTATGVALPADLKLRFVEQPADVDALIVLPGYIDQDELTPQELEAVAGGLESVAAICWDTCGTTCDRSCSNTCAVTEITPV